MSLRILAHTMRIAVATVGRQHSPIVRGLVLMVAFPENRFRASGFVRGSQDQGGCEPGRDKVAPAGWHRFPHSPQLILSETGPRPDGAPAQLPRNSPIGASGPM